MNNSENERMINRYVYMLCLMPVPVHAKYNYICC